MDSHLKNIIVINFLTVNIEIYLLLIIYEYHMVKEGTGYHENRDNKRMALTLPINSDKVS